jgi:phosphoribosyl 1,2-cyclic phosphodiesterase
LRLLFCGVRGSTPAPGAAFVRYGGHTSCVAVAHGDDDPVLVLDGGTGLQALTRHLGGRPFRGTILLGHLHWDHTHGLPFFASGDQPGSDVTVAMPAQGDAEQVLARAISPPHFPVTPSQLRGAWTFTGLEEGTHRFGGFDVEAREIPHKGGRTFGYRVSDGSSAVAYLSDHSPTADGVGPDGFGTYHDAAMALATGVDVLVHDAQHTAAEFGPKAHFGHSCVDYAVGLAEAAGARHVVLFHHDPQRTDDELDAIVAAHQRDTVKVTAAAEGTVLEL